MTTQEYELQLEEALRLVSRGVPKQVMSKVGLDLKALVSRRVIKKNIDAAGVSWGGYSEAYKKRRDFLRKRNQNKNFELSGEMWLGFDIKNLFQSRVVLGGTTKDSQDRINWNSEREGREITEPSKKEVDRVSSYIEKWITELLTPNK